MSHTANMSMKAFWEAVERRPAACSRNDLDAIVGGQKRGAYHKAAALTVACAEALELRGDPEPAQALMQEIRGRYPRHSSFQRLFKRAL